MFIDILSSGKRSRSSLARFSLFVFWRVSGEAQGTILELFWVLGGLFGGLGSAMEPPWRSLGLLWGLFAAPWASLATTWVHFGSIWDEFGFP